jgi:5-methylcytosine-specific restriction protein A
MSSLERVAERQEIYQSKRWKELRKKLQMERPLCENCLKKGVIKAMEECHHVLSPFQKGITEEEKYRRAYDEKNILCLCKDCHIKMHHQDELTMKEKIQKYSD